MPVVAAPVGLSLAVIPAGKLLCSANDALNVAAVFTVPPCVAAVPPVPTAVVLCKCRFVPSTEVTSTSPTTTTLTAETIILAPVPETAVVALKKSKKSSDTPTAPSGISNRHTCLHG